LIKMIQTTMGGILQGDSISVERKEKRYVGVKVHSVKGGRGGEGEEEAHGKKGREKEQTVPESTKKTCGGSWSRRGFRIKA